MKPNPEDKPGSPDDGTVLSTAMRSEIPSRYRIVQNLGAGGMGEVFLAEDTKLPRRVAIKTIREDMAKKPEVRKRIERECRMHAQMGSHPNIVTLHDRLEDGDRISLVMEFVEGETLQDLLERLGAEGGRLSWAEGLLIACQTLDALSRIHSHGIVHRDIKPSNIMVGRSDSGHYLAKLMDFGIARQEVEEEGATILTQEGTGGPGTPLYMAPEQIDRKTFGDVSPATDIYAMGVVLYQIVSGKPPFMGSLTEVFNGHLNRQPPPLAISGQANIPPALERVLQKALAKEPTQRYESARAFRQELEALQSGAAALGDTPPPVPPPRKKSKSTGEKTLVSSGQTAADLIKGGTVLDTSAARRGGVPKLVWVGLAAVLLLMLSVGGVGAAYYMWRPAEAEVAEKPGKTPADTPEPVDQAKEVDTPPLAPAVDQTKIEITAVTLDGPATLPPPSEARVLPPPDLSSNAPSTELAKETTPGSAVEELERLMKPSEPAPDVPVAATTTASAKPEPAATQPKPASTKPKTAAPKPAVAQPKPEPKPVAVSKPDPPKSTSNSGSGWTVIKKEVKKID